MVAPIVALHTALQWHHSEVAAGGDACYGKARSAAPTLMVLSEKQRRGVRSRGCPLVILSQF
jgi:hypothetical protein